jgi:hypothetical protein
MKTGKLKKFETVAAPGIIADTPEELAALIADLLLIAERMPVEKFSSSESTKIISGDAEILDKKNLTKFDTDAKTDTEINSGDDTGTFSNEQLLILEQIQNGE